MPCYQIKIFGLVQGVFFRHSAKMEAEKLGLVGYVKNAPDGSVGIVACGGEEKLKEFINWCRQGPDLANVEKVETKGLPSREFQDFQII